MTAQEIIDDAKVDVQQTDSNGLTDAQFLLILNDGYTDFCRYTEMRTKNSTVVVNALESIVSLPTDFLESREMRWSYNRQLYPRSVRKLDYDNRDWMFEVGTPESLVYHNFNVMRLKPITNAAGTCLFRHTFIPTALTLTDTPDIPDIYHPTLTKFVDAMYFAIYREYDSMGSFWQDYVKGRLDARKQSLPNQMTPDTMLGQRNVNTFNYPMWDHRYRTNR